MNTVKCSNRLCKKEYNVEFDNCPFCGASNPKEDSERKSLIEKEKTSEENTSDEAKSQFNGFVIGLIWVSIIFFGIRGVMTSFANMVFNPAIGWLTLGLSILGIISLAFILQAKRWALFLWMAYRLSAGIVNGYISVRFDFATNIIIAIANIGLMVLILQIKKDGVSAWSIIFNKKKCNETNNRNDNSNVNENDSKNESNNNVDNNINDTFDSSVEDGISTETQIDNNEELQTAPCMSSQNETIQLKEEPIMHVQEESSKENTNSTLTKSQEIEPEKYHVRQNRKTILKFGRWWIYPILIVATLAIIWIVVWFSHRQTDSKLGKYVYVDEYSILHIDRNCGNIANVHGTKPIAIYSVNELTQENWKHVCSNCVSDKVYETINQKVIGNGNLRNVYNILVNEGYTPPDFSQFVMDMKDTCNLHGVKATLQKEGYIIPSFSQFMIDMGVDSTQPPIKMVGYEKCNLRELYDNLKKDGYNDIGTYQEFYNWCNTEGDQGIKNRKKLYKCLVNDNYDMPDFDTYIRDLFNIKFWGE